MKYIINKDTGKKYCLDCKLYECICLPETKDYFDSYRPRPKIFLSNDIINKSFY